MTWKPIAVNLLRGLINDLGGTYVYSDSRLEELLTINAYLLTSEIDFDYSYTVDIVDLSISPDPDTNSDIDFISLLVLKCCCMIKSGEYKDDSLKAVATKDGPSSIDMRSRVDHKKEIAHKACEDYEKAKIAFMAGDRSVGRAIVGSYNSGSAASSKTFN